MRTIGALLLAIALNAAAIYDTHAEDAPDFNLKTPSGERIQLKSLLKEGPVLLDFWAMWCTPCLKAMPKLQALYDAHKENGLTVLAINEDSLRGQAMVRSFLRAQNYTFPVVLDNSDGGVMWQMKVTALPTTILIDRNGKIVLQLCGYSAAKAKLLKRAVEALLKMDAMFEVMGPVGGG